VNKKQKTRSCKVYHRCGSYGPWRTTLNRSEAAAAPGSLYLFTRLKLTGNVLHPTGCDAWCS